MTARTTLATLAVVALLTPSAARAQVDSLVARLMTLPSDSVDFMVGGRIVSAADGRPVGGASVFLEGTTIGSFTDAAGRFRLDGVRAGPHRLWVRLIGYHSACVNVELFDDRMQSLLVALPPNPRRQPRARLCGDPEIVEPPVP